MNKNDLIHFNNGGSHNSNPLGGIPMGQNNTVEQGETRQNDFIYSDRIVLDENIIQQFKLPKSFTNKTIAEATKIIDKKFTDRNDRISQSTKNSMLAQIAQVQEAMKPQEEIPQEQMSMEQLPQEMTGQQPMFMGGELDTENAGENSYLSMGTKMLPSLLSGNKENIINTGVETGLGIAGTAIGGPIGGMIGSTVGKAVTPMISKLLNKSNEDKENYKKAVIASSQFNNDFALGGVLPKPPIATDWKGFPYPEPSMNPDLTGLGINPNWNKNELDIPRLDRQITESNIDLNNSLTDKNKKNKKVDLSKLGDTLGQAARYAPIGMNAYQLSKLQKPNYERLNRLDARFKPEYVDERSLQNIVGNEYDNTVNAITQMGGSTGATRNAILAAGLNKSKALGDAYVNANAQNRQMNVTGQQFNLGIDQANLNQANQELDINDRNQAAYRNEKSKYLSEIGNGIGDIGKEEVYKKIAKTTTGYNWLGEYQKANPNATSKQIQEAALKAGVLATEDDTDTKKSLGGYLIKNKRK